MLALREFPECKFCDHTLVSGRGLDVPAGTYNLLAPADMNPLHYTRIVVYTRRLGFQSKLAFSFSVI